MMSRTAAIRLAMGELDRAARHATWSAVVVAAAVATLFVASMVRSMAAAHAMAVGSAAPASVDALTSFGPIRSHLGRVRGEVVSHPALVSGTDQSWMVRLSTPRGANIQNARVVVEVYMPESAERMHTAPVVRYIGDGRYKIDGLRFSRTGWWNVALRIQSTLADSLAFNLIVVR